MASKGGTFQFWSKFEIFVFAVNYGELGQNLLKRTISTLRNSQSRSIIKENEIQIGANAIEDNENSDSIQASGKDEGVVEEMEIVLFIKE